MDTWHDTCTLTNLPITEGERVVLYPLQLESEALVYRHGGGYGYAHNVAKPITLPVRGAYNGQGGILLDETEISSAVARYFEVNRGKFSHYDGTSLEYEAPRLEAFLNEDVERGRIRTEGLVRVLHKTDPSQIGFETHEGVAPLALMLMHERAYDAMVKSCGEASPRSVSECDTLHRAYQGDLAAYARKMAEREAQLDDVRDQLETAKTCENVAEGKRLVTELCALFRSDIIDSQRTLGLFREFTAHTYSFLQHFAPEAHRSTAVFTELLGMLIFSEALNTLRKSWFNQAGSCSQNNSTNLHEALAHFVLNHCAAQREGRALA